MKESTSETERAREYLGERRYCELCQVDGECRRAVGVLDPEDPLGRRAACVRHIAAPPEVFEALRQSSPMGQPCDETSKTA
jgi:hypothetical protein